MVSVEFFKYFWAKKKSIRFTTKFSEEYKHQNTIIGTVKVSGCKALSKNTPTTRMHKISPDKLISRVINIEIISSIIANAS